MMRTFLGTAAAVMASLAIPIGLIVLAAFPAPSAEEGDDYIRGVIGIGALIPPFAVLLVIYHGLGVVAARALPIRPSVALLVLSALASGVLAALFLASGAPLSWDRIGAFGTVMGSIWMMLALGSAVQYFACVNKRSNRLIDPDAE